ncbi:helix-turn-helix domain-containing protein [Allomesorhizobium camelthorni]|uniref:Helix-turn-helix transcriptional regulator n=1 Tax=Allomesorhizobium camelthorni TaxID=475069 RepID=A0A6G4WPJ8_9HYPH|nr:helix-turn-helix transcriptional regulator [Mesorhizobium camelthorni]NGO56113.1 helix-turn-helix transcriptional regulator [Mesorhizobium camelthorni]
MSYSGKDYALPETVAVAVGAGANIVRTIRDSVGYSIEELALTCGLAFSEIADLESGIDADPIKLRRIATALRLPENALLR